MLFVILSLLLTEQESGRSKSRSFNDVVLEVIATYPTDGSYGYWWPRGSTWEGTTQDLVYDGQKICTGDPQKRSYCCGLTFEAFFKAYEKYCAERKQPFKIANLTGNELREMRLRWFGAAGNGDKQKLVQEAVTSMGVGTAVARLEDARPGDFVQLWRRDGSGHSVVFLRWESAGGRITGITYWSTQPSTKGIGSRTERFGDKTGVDRNRIFIVRVVPP